MAGFKDLSHMRQEGLEKKDPKLAKLPIPKEVHSTPVEQNIETPTVSQSLVPPIVKKENLELPSSPINRNPVKTTNNSLAGIRELRKPDTIEADKVKPAVPRKFYGNENIRNLKYPETQVPSNKFQKEKYRKTTYDFSAKNLNTDVTRKGANSWLAVLIHKAKSFIDHWRAYQNSMVQYGLGQAQPVQPNLDPNIEKSLTHGFRSSGSFRNINPKDKNDLTLGYASAHYRKNVLDKLDKEEKERLFRQWNKRLKEHGHLPINDIDQALNLEAHHRIVHSLRSRSFQRHGHDVEMTNIPAIAALLQAYNRKTPNAST